MSFSFQNQGYNTYLCYEVDTDKEIDSLSMGMLTNNKINGFAQTLFSQVDEKRYLRYNVTSKVSVRQFFSGVINKKSLLSVFCGITKAYLVAEEYMLDTSSIIFDLDYIFVDVSTVEVSMICLPVKESNEVVDAKKFFKDILLNCKFDQSENGDYFAKLLNYLNSSDEINFEDFDSFLGLLNNFSVNSSMEHKGSSSVNAGGEVVSETPAIVKDTANAVASVSNVNSFAVTSVAGVVNHFSNQPVYQNVSDTFVSPDLQVSIPVKTDGSEIKYENNSVGAGDVAIPNMSPVAAEEKKDKSKEKKSGGMFSFLHKEKKEKPQKTEKKSKKNDDASTAKSNTFGNIAIPGQVVPPTVKTEVKNDPEIKTPVLTNVSRPVSNVNEQDKQNINSMNVQVQQPVASVKIQIQEPVAVCATGVPVNSGAVNFGETTVLGSGLIGETTVLGVDMNAMAPMPYIIRSKNHEKISINKPIFRIGKERSYVDYFVNDNTAISRSHANIITREGRYFIVDTNSTNHTFIDGRMIPSNSECEIGHGTKIRLANEDFEFNLY